MNAARELLLSKTDEEIDRAALKMRGWKPSYFRWLVAALNAPEERKRWYALHDLGGRGDERAAPHLIRVLRNRKETTRLRGDAADLLASSVPRAAIRRLIACSRDPSPEVRFWCVFALGNCQHRRRTVVQALEARLDDYESPPDGSWWTVALEALAALRNERRVQFDDKMREVLSDPLWHPREWQWAVCYGDDSPLYESAVQTIRAAGFDPERFGREPATTLARSEPRP